MTPPQPILRVRREDLARALRLPPPDLRVLVWLLVHACASTGRVWEPPERIAESLDLPESLVHDALFHLSGQDFLEEFPTVARQLRCIELGAVFLRSMPGPENLPVEPRAI
ncbi:MAG: hypothetical protein IT379_14940 [Deltaproteobacteria bacterium]|nr:hypothetical protein [Deltaproteobacteria bacterium]